MGFDDVPVRSARRGRRPFAALVVGLGDDDRGNPLHFGAEAEVEIPLVADRERLDAAGDRVFGEAFDLGDPVGIGRVAGLVIAVEPVDEFVAGRPLGDLDRVMHAVESDVLADEFPDDFQMVAPDNGMASAAVHVEDDRGRAVEDMFIVRPAAGGEHGVGPRDVARALLEQLRAGVVLLYS